MNLTAPQGAGQQFQVSKEHVMPRKKSATKPATKTSAKKTSTKKVSTKKAAEAPKEKKSRGLGKVKEATLAAMKEIGGKMTHAQVAEVTGKKKGNQLRELTELGLVNTEVPEEGKREHTFSLTAEGRKVASKLK